MTKDHVWLAADSQRLWKFANDETVLISHALQNDLNVLGIYHPRIVDSAILTSLAVFPSWLEARTWSLMSLAREFIDLDIQNGNCGHDAVEDARVIPEVVLWCLAEPEQLKIWADKARIQQERSMGTARINDERAQAARNPHVNLNDQTDREDDPQKSPKDNGNAWGHPCHTWSVPNSPDDSGQSTSDWPRDEIVVATSTSEWSDWGLSPGSDSSTPEWGECDVAPGLNSSTSEWSSWDSVPGLNSSTSEDGWEPSPHG